MLGVSNGTTKRQASAEGEKVGMSKDLIILNLPLLSAIRMPATKEIPMIGNGESALKKPINNQRQHK